MTAIFAEVYSNLYSPNITRYRNIKNTVNRYVHKKNVWKNIHRPQPDSGEVSTYYIFITITQNTHNIAEQLPLSQFGKFIYGISNKYAA